MNRIDDTLYNILDSNTDESITYNKVTTFIDGQPMSDEKCDGIIYRKKGSEYFKRNYTGSVDVAWFGAKGDGVTDDSLAIQAANDFVESTGTFGAIIFSTGTYITSGINLSPRVSLIGAGTKNTTIKAKAGESAPAVIQTKGYDDLVGTTSLGGSFRNIITNLTVDGNKSNSGAIWGIRLYGKGFQLKHLSIESCLGTGLYTEYDGGDDFSTPEKTLEAMYSNISIQQCNGHGWEFNGPHDSTCDKIIIFSNSLWGWVVKKAISATSVNTYLCNSGGIWAFGDGAAIKGNDIIGSTALGYGALLQSGGHNITGIFGGPIGLEIQANNNLITGAIGNTTDKGLSLNGASAQGVFDLVMFNNTGVVFSVVNTTSKSIVNAVCDGSGTLQDGAFNGTWVITGGVNQNQIEGGLTIQGGKLYLPKTDYVNQGSCGIFFDHGIPEGGNFTRGDRIFNSEPSVGSPKGWICTVSGTPGTWVSEGNL